MTSDWLLRVLALAAVLSIAAFGFAGWSIVRSDNRLESALLALCALQDDLERRVLAGSIFLEKNPNGVAGISRGDIERSLENQQRTLSALEPHLTDCPEEAAP